MDGTILDGQELAAGPVSSAPDLDLDWRAEEWAHLFGEPEPCWSDVRERAALDF